MSLIPIHVSLRTAIVAERSMSYFRTSMVPLARIRHAHSGDGANQGCQSVCSAYFAYILGGGGAEVHTSHTKFLFVWKRDSHGILNQNQAALETRRCEQGKRKKVK